MKNLDLTSRKLSRRQLLQTTSASAAIALLAPAARAQKEVVVKPEPIANPGLAVVALNRLSFGPRTGQVEAFLNLGKTPEKALQAWLEIQTHPESIKDGTCEEKIAALQLKTMNKTMEQLWADHVALADRLKDAPASPTVNKGDENKLRLLPASETEAATWTRAVYSERQLQEVLVNFWHDHFSVYAWDQKIASTFVHYDRDVIRKHAFGNFRQMLEAVAQSPAMLLYLDNGINQSGNPNENYARELFELHTLGAENYLGTRERTQVARVQGEPAGYVDGDVYEAARCFTGWRLDQGGNSGNTGTFQYFEPWHDRFQKVVLGKPLKEYQPPLKDGHDVLDALTAHHGTARFLARKLCRRFVGEEPSAALIDKTAKLFHEQKNAPDQIKRVVRAIVSSDEFKNSWGTKMRRPFEATVGFLRALNADFTPSEKFLKNFENAGQRLFSWRSPDGFPDGREKWLGSNTFVERWRLMQQILLGTIDGVQIDEDKVLRVAGDDPLAFVTQLSARVHRPLTDISRKNLIAFLERNEKRPRRFLFATGMLFLTPEMQWS